MTTLDGYEVHLIDYLPKTIKDRDGKDVPLLGVILSDIQPTYYDLFDPKPYSGKIVFLVGEPK